MRVRRSTTCRPRPSSTERLAAISRTTGISRPSTSIEDCAYETLTARTSELNTRLNRSTMAMFTPNDTTSDSSRLVLRMRFRMTACIA
jgi:hypothetical protein